jgi:8-oxo-dGTP diphosphatase
VTPQAAVIAVLVRGDAVLLVRRRNPPNRGFWGYPGGRIEPGEPLADATLRELREETGVAADFLRAFAAVDAIAADAETGALHHYVLVAGLCRWRAGEPEAADDALEAAWFPIATLDRGPAPLLDRVAALALEARDLLAAPTP